MNIFLLFAPTAQYIKSTPRPLDRYIPVHWVVPSKCQRTRRSLSSVLGRMTSRFGAAAARGAGVRTRQSGHRAGSALLPRLAAGSDRYGGPLPKSPDPRGTSATYIAAQFAHQRQSSGFHSPCCSLYPIRHCVSFLCVTIVGSVSSPSHPSAVCFSLYLV